MQCEVCDRSLWWSWRLLCPRRRRSCGPMAASRWRRETAPARTAGACRTRIAMRPTCPRRYGPSTSNAACRPSGTPFGIGEEEVNLATGTQRRGDDNRPVHGCCEPRRRYGAQQGGLPGAATCAKPHATCELRFAGDRAADERRSAVAVRSLLAGDAEASRFSPLAGESGVGGSKSARGSGTEGMKPSALSAVVSVGLDSGQESPVGARRVVAARPRRRWNAPPSCIRRCARRPCCRQCRAVPGRATPGGPPPDSFPTHPSARSVVMPSAGLASIGFPARVSDRSVVAAVGDWRADTSRAGQRAQPAAPSGRPALAAQQVGGAAELGGCCTGGGWPARRWSRQLRERGSLERLPRCPARPHPPLEQPVPADHRLRAIRALTDEALRRCRRSWTACTRRRAGRRSRRSNCCARCSGRCPTGSRANGC